MRRTARPAAKRPDGGDTGLNENYARELMELHTLGVDGGYTQDDVVALARILTGWSHRSHAESLARRLRLRVQLGAPRCRAQENSSAMTSKRAARPKGMEALDILARIPATARHIAFKLAQYFVADQPPPALVERLAARFPRPTETSARC